MGQQTATSSSDSITMSLSCKHPLQYTRLLPVAVWKDRLQSATDHSFAYKVTLRFVFSVFLYTATGAYVALLLLLTCVRLPKVPLQFTKSVLPLSVAYTL